MTQLYDEEVEMMRKVGQDLQRKWEYVVAKLPDNPLHNKTSRQMIERWHSEAIKVFEGIGWKAEVDVTPALAGIGTPVISVLEPLEAREFDYEKKQSEVLKSRAQGGI